MLESPLPLRAAESFLVASAATNRLTGTRLYGSVFPDMRNIESDKPCRVTLRNYDFGPRFLTRLQQKGYMKKYTSPRLAIMALLAFAMALFAPSTQAALDASITNIVTDLTGFFGSIQTLIISVVVFGLAIGYAKMLRRK